MSDCETNLTPGLIPNTPPLVSILIATRDRLNFIPYLLDCINAQTYPSNRIQLVVGDDGRESSKHLFPVGTKFITYPPRF